VNALSLPSLLVLSLQVLRGLAAPADPSSFPFSISLPHLTHRHSFAMPTVCPSCACLLLPSSSSPSLTPFHFQIHRRRPTQRQGSGTTPDRFQRRARHLPGGSSRANGGEQKVRLRLLFVYYSCQPSYPLSFVLLTDRSLASVDGRGAKEADYRTSWRSCRQETGKKDRFLRFLVPDTVLSPPLLLFVVSSDTKVNTFPP
jgi:hypothetical protein